MKKYIKLFALAIVSSLMLSACSTKSSNSASDVSKDGSSDKVKVYTSFYPMYDFTKKIGGDKVEVENLVPAGTEPHDWEPNPKDIVKIGESDVFVYSGAGMEEWIDKLKESIGSDKTEIVEASKGVNLIKTVDDDHVESDDMDDHDDHNDDIHDHDNGDPHVWLNPQNAKIQMKNIKDALVKVDGKNKDYYEKNFEEYSKKLDELDSKFKTELSTTSKKDIVVSHEAFGYLAAAYGLNQVGIEGLSPDSEPDASRMRQVSEFAKKNGVKYIFFEELVSDKVSKTIANEVGAKTAVLSPIEGLSEEQIKAGDDYFSIMEKNLENLLLALR